jgi:hypothetical protein
MASYEDREAFIPYRRTDVIELCLEDGQLSDADAQKFRDFCTILVAYYHFKFHAYQERLKCNYAPFNPDASANKLREEPTPEQLADMEAKLVNDFETILKRANYVPISPDSLQRAFKEKSVIELKTKVDFGDFDRIICYCRGDTYKVIQVKKFYFWKEDKKIDIFERVVLLIKFKDKDYFRDREEDIDSLNFTPGHSYLYYYKDIPRLDIELLFPNIKLSMTWKDRLLFGIPAVGAAVPVILKALPRLALLVGVILFFTMGTTNILGYSFDEEDVQNFMPVLTATLSLVLVLGGFAYKQYSKYKSKQIKFRKNVTDTLFFKNLANNKSVFQALIDAAEEEECKEIILAYYHLLTSKEPLTPEQLDNRIEGWMNKKFDTKIDFDIIGLIENLEGIRGKVVKDDEDPSDKSEVSLLSKDEQGRCQVLPLEKAKILIDYIWDNLFLYT